MKMLTHANPEAETMCLACILADDTYLRDTMLEPTHFSVQAYEGMFAIMIALYQTGKRVDMVSVSDKSGDFETIARVIEASPATSPQAFRHYEAIVIDAWKRRQAHSILARGRAAIDETMDLTSIPSLIADLQALDSYGAQDAEPFEQTVQRVFDDLMDSDGTMTGVTTGLTDLNTMLYGWQDENLYVVAARPSVGKTAFVLHAMIEAAKKDTACNLFALEMSRDENVKRMLTDVGLLSGMKMRAPKRHFDNKDWTILAHAVDHLKTLPIDIWDRPYVTVADIRARVRYMAARHKDKKQLVVIDYLQLIPVHETNGKNKAQLYGDIVRNLKMMAREYRVPVILVSQLNRSVETRQNKHPMMSDLRESGEIEQHADGILLLHREDYYDKETEKKNVIEINVAKQRNGPVGPVEAVYLRDFQRFVDLERGSQGGQTG